MASITHLLRPLRGLIDIHPHMFDTNPRTVEGPVVHIGETPGAEWFSIDIKVRQNHVGSREYPLGATHPSEFAQTLPKSIAGRFKTIESLNWVEWRLRGRELAAAYLVQIVDKPG